MEVTKRAERVLLGPMTKVVPLIAESAATVKVVLRRVEGDEKRERGREGRVEERRGGRGGIKIDTSS